MVTMSAKALGLILCGAVATAGAADFPPLSDTTPTAEHFPGKFIWADLFTVDPAAAQAFYTGLFGWEATTIERTTTSGTHPYIVLANGGEPVAGIARRPSRLPEAVHGRWVGYVSVPDVAKALAAATAAADACCSPRRICRGAERRRFLPIPKVLNSACSTPVPAIRANMRRTPVILSGRSFSQAIPLPKAVFAPPSPAGRSCPTPAAIAQTCLSSPAAVIRAPAWCRCPATAGEARLAFVHPS